MGQRTHHDYAHHLHAHGEGDAAHQHTHEPRPAQRRALLVALLLTGGFALIEAAGGFYANSLALISDAGHMAADAGALLIALVAAKLAARPVSERNSFGYGRAEVIGAFVNALTMLAIVVWIIGEAVSRIFKPLLVAGAAVMVIAMIGMGVNLVVLWMLSRASAGDDAHAGQHHSSQGGHGHGSLNTRAAMIHVLGDLLGSVAAIIAGAVVLFTGWTLIDPLLSVFVALLILRSTWSLARESVNVLMEAVPEGIEYREVGRALAAMEGVVSVHDLHVWQMSANRRALSAHLRLSDGEGWPRVLTEARATLLERFSIDHVTLQPEWLPPQAGKIIPIKVEVSPAPSGGHTHG